MKRTLLTLMILTSALTLAACRKKTDMVTVTGSPSPSVSATGFPDMLPMGDDMLPDMRDGMNEMLDGMSASPSSAPTSIPEATGVTSMEKARRVVEQIEDELERLSEVEDAQVVIAGNRAAVALEFDDQYKGGVDDRLRGIVRERISSVISGVDDVVITADPEIMDALETLGERLQTMSDMSALQSDLDAIIRRIEGA